MENIDQTTFLSFRLTRLQRVMNPLTRLGLAVIGIFGYLVLAFAGIVTTVQHVIADGVWHTLSDPSYWGCMGIMVFGFVMFFYFIGYSIIGVYACLTKNYYINTVALAEKKVFFGIDGIQREMIFPSLVYRGLFRTYVISNRGSCAVVIPDNVISLQELKRLIEKKKTVAESDQQNETQ